jgi:hypothetical protein
LLFEDLHWIDSETQGFLDVLSEGVASAKLLLLESVLKMDRIALGDGNTTPTSIPNGSE